MTMEEFQKIKMVVEQIRKIEHDLEELRYYDYSPSSLRFVINQVGGEEKIGLWIPVPKDLACDTAQCLKNRLEKELANLKAKLEEI